MEDRLVQEQIDNGDLTARLDDARNLLRDRGIDAGRTSRLAGRGEATIRPPTTRRRDADLAGRPGTGSAASRRSPRFRPGRDRSAGPGRRGYRRPTRAIPERQADRSEPAARRRPRSPFVPPRPARDGSPSPMRPTIPPFRSADSIERLGRPSMVSVNAAWQRGEIGPRSTSLGRRPSQGDFALKLSHQLATDRQPQPAALDPGVFVAGQPEERLENPVEGFGGDARSRVRDDHRPGIGLDFPSRRELLLPTGVYFRALETRLPKICWQRDASVTTTDSGRSAWDSQLICRAEATGANWRSISSIKCADRE